MTAFGPKSSPIVNFLVFHILRYMPNSFNKFRSSMRRTFILIRRLEPALAGVAIILMSIHITAPIIIPFLAIAAVIKFTIGPIQEIDEELTKIVYKKRSCPSRTLKMLGTTTGELVVGGAFLVYALSFWHLISLPFFVVPTIFIVGFSCLLAVYAIAGLAALWNDTEDDRTSYILAGICGAAMAAAIIWIVFGHLQGTASILMLIVGIAFCLVAAMKFERKAIKNEELEKFRVNTGGVNFVAPPIVDALTLKEAIKEHRSLLSDETIYKPAPFFGYPWSNCGNTPVLGILQKNESSFLGHIPDNSTSRLLDPHEASSDDSIGNIITPPVSPIKQRSNSL